MHCPRCGSDALIGQPFCRSCGLNLETVSELLTEQPPANQNANLTRIHDKQVKLERWANLAGLGAFGVILLLLAYTVVSEMILAGMVVPGVFVLLLATGVAVKIGLRLYARSLKQELKRVRSPLEVEATRSLTQLKGPESVTEHTTELLSRSDQESAISNQ